MIFNQDKLNYIYKIALDSIKENFVNPPLVNSEYPNMPLPPLAKSIFTLNFPKDHRGHTVYPVRKNSEPADNAQTYYFKKNKFGNRAAELETYCAMICRFLATDEYVPSTREYADAKNSIIGISSKAFVDFKTNNEDPLTKEDTVIDNSLLELMQQQNQVMVLVNTLLDNLGSKVDNYENYFEDKKNALKSIFIKASTETLTDYEFFKFLKNLKNFKDKLSVEMIDEALNILNNKRAQFSSDNMENKFNITVIKLANHLNELKRLQQVPRLNPITIEEIERIHQIVKARGIDLNKAGEYVRLKIGRKRLSIKTADLQHYNILRGCAVALSTRYLYKEDDTNDNNVSKSGKMVDFGWTKANITFKYKQNNLFDNVIRFPSPGAFKCTSRDIETFPVTNDTHVFYWPTKKVQFSNAIIEVLSNFINQYEDFFLNLSDTNYTGVARITEEVVKALLEKAPSNSLKETIAKYVLSLVLQLKSYLISQDDTFSQEKKKIVFDVLKKNFIQYVTDNKNVIDDFANLIVYSNAFKDEDIEAYSYLRTHPVFQFHKYKTFLKYILSETDFYQAIAALTVSPAQKSEAGQALTPDIQNELVQDEATRIQEVSSQLYEMGEFRQFLIDHGNFAFDMIKNEIQQYKNKYSNKPEKSYQQLVDALDMNTLEKKFAAIREKMGLDVGTHNARMFL